MASSMDRLVSVMTEVVKEDNGAAELEIVKKDVKELKATTAKVLTILERISEQLPLNPSN
jgi:hypothetical protein